MTTNPDGSSTEIDANGNVINYDKDGVKDWRACSFEDNLRMCMGPDNYWNELTCMCFYTTYCDLECDPV